MCDWPTQVNNTELIHANILDLQALSCLYTLKTVQFTVPLSNWALYLPTLLSRIQELG